MRTRTRLTCLCNGARPGAQIPSTFLLSLLLLRGVSNARECFSHSLDDEYGCRFVSFFGIVSDVLQRDSYNLSVVGCIWNAERCSLRFARSQFLKPIFRLHTVQNSLRICDAREDVFHIRLGKILRVFLDYGALPEISIPRCGWVLLTFLCTN